MLPETSLSDPQGKKVPFLEFIVEGKTLQSYNQYVTGQDLKQRAGIPVDTDLYLSIAQPWTDELIENHTKVDLARPSIEYFYVKKKLHLTINGVAFTWYKQYISESEIKVLGKINETDDVYLKIKLPFEDELIAGGANVDLARPGKENFISKSKPIFNLLVNAQLKSWKLLTISFEQVVTLAFGSYSENANKANTVVFSNGPKEKPKGVMVKGDSVHVKDEMKFDVSATDKS